MIDRKNITVDSLAQAIKSAVENQSIRTQAAILGEKIRSENGVKEVVEILNKQQGIGSL